MFSAALEDFLDVGNKPEYQKQMSNFMISYCIIATFIIAYYNLYLVIILIISSFFSFTLFRNV